MSSDRYKSLGASATKEGIHKALSSAGLPTESEYFAHLLPDFAGDPEMCSFLHADGAGTKSIVSYLMFKNTGDPGCFAGLAQDALVMNLDDVFCVGTPESLYLSNTIGRNARLIPDEAVEAIVAQYVELSKQLGNYGVDVELAGGETADCGDVVRTLMVDAVLAGRIPKNRLITPRRIEVGDAIVGLASFGKASYESTVNSGIGSNGLTLARHCLLHSAYKSELPECVDPFIDPNHSYSGPYRVEDTENGLEMTIGEALSSPTRTFAPVLKNIYAVLADDIHGVIHLTGGAHTKVLRFARAKKFLKTKLIEAPKIFELIQNHGKVSWEEMYRVFNMGCRIELYVPHERVEELCRISESFGIHAQKVGEVLEADGEQSSVEIHTAAGEFTYTL